MRLLILTQAIDTDDRALGFFHRWVEEFAARFDALEVVCLKEGVHALPHNVRVYSLGKEKGRSRAKYIFNFYRHVLSLRYDAVLVHMNEEYVLLGGWWWRLRGKKVVLWRNHKMGSWRTRLAVRLSSAVCYTSPDAFVAPYAKAVRMPVGIDTDFFKPASRVPAGGTILFLGRVDPVKKVEVFVGALVLLAAPAHVELYGSPTEPGSPYAAAIAAQAQPLALCGVLAMHPGVPHERTAELYRSHAIYVNLTPSGSFDKTIGEAMASGCAVVCANAAVRDVLPGELFVREITPAAAAAALGAALGLGDAARAELARRNRDYVEREHSLKLLAGRLQAILTK